MGDGSPECRATIAGAAAAGFDHEQPALWEFRTNRGWLQIGPRREGFESLLTEDIDND